MTEKSCGELRLDPDDWDGHSELADRPQIIVGGPGTGKTQFLCDKVVNAVTSGCVSPDEIVFLTFSRQGVNDIRTRLFDSIRSESYKVNVSTYHSLAMRIVESNAQYLGWSSPPTVLAGAEQEHFVLDLLSTESPEKWHKPYREILNTEEMAGEITDFILRCNEHLLGPGDVTSFGRDQWRSLPEFFERYLAAQVKEGRTDYGRLLTDAVRAVEEIPEISSRYRLVVADEFQDTSPVQSRLLLGLAANTPNLIVAADPYQSIYSFRGSDIKNVFDLPVRTEKALGLRAERIVLTTSFRVPAEILSAAVSVTARELPGGAGKVQSIREGGSVSAHTFSLKAEEADWISRDIEHVHLREGVPLERIAIFTRNDSPFVGELSRALNRREIPHTKEETRLVDQPIIRFVRDLVTAASSGEGADEALKRALQSPYIGVQPGAMISMTERRSSGEEWSSIVGSSVHNGAELELLLSDTKWATKMRAPEGLWHLWSKLPQLAEIATESSYLPERRSWASLAQALERLNERVGDATLVDHEKLAGHSDFEADPLFNFRVQGKKGVTVTTLHRSKGTSFDVVYIAEANEGTLPDLRATDSLLGSRHLNPHLPTDTTTYRAFKLDEERRLAYTAMTRASSKVVWTATSAHVDGGTRPSRFLPLVAPLTASSHKTDPLTHRSFEAMLRRRLTDTSCDAIERLAASVVLADGPNNGLSEPLKRYRTRETGPDNGIITEELKMSPSQADGYSACPRKYAVERYLMTRSEETNYTRLGSLIHKVLEDTEIVASESAPREFAPRKITLITAIALLDDHWDEYGFGDDPIGMAWKRRAAKMLNDIYTLWPSTSKPIFFETGLDLVVDGTPWRGRADLIEERKNGVVVVDYKTGEASTKSEAAESIQLGYYVLAAAAHPELSAHGEIVGAEFWYTKYANKDSLRTDPFAMGQLDNVREMMSEITENILSENFTPTPGKVCDKCPVELVCPARQPGREAFS